jgi:hypothetical protein
MRIPLLVPVVALTVAQPSAYAQVGPWGNVKAWTGSLTIEATATGKGPTGSWGSTMTYKATGPFTISDNAMPDGAHMRWPMLGAEDVSDPQKVASASTRWQSRVTGHFEAKGVDEAMRPFSVTCDADHQQLAKVEVSINATEPTFFLWVTAPAAQFKCRGPAGSPTPGGLPQADFELTGPRGTPGPVSGTKTFTVASTTIKVSFDMAPAK